MEHLSCLLNNFDSPQTSREYSFDHDKSAAPDYRGYIPESPILETATPRNLETSFESVTDSKEPVKKKIVHVNLS